MRIGVVRWTIRVVPALLAALCAAGQSSAAVLEVNAAGGTPYATIQSAVDAAVPGVDSVFVHCGRYVENVAMRDGVPVAGADPRCVVVDGGQSGPVFSFVNVGAGTSLQGCTVTNGRADFGGGIFLQNSGAIISGNIIVGNGTNSFGSGGGISSEGTFLAPEGVQAPSITGNVIRGNFADELGGGISIYYEIGTLITNNLIVDNTARQAGGAIEVTLGQPQIVNNTLVGNCTQSAGMACDLGGGGIRLTDSTLVQVANNVISRNEAAFAGGGVDAVNSTVDFDANDTWANAPTNYNGIADPTGVDGNISLDPAFVNEYRHFGGYMPRSDSPLIEVAMVAAAPASDLRGIPRPQDGDADGTAAPDIGAREDQGITGLRFDDADDLRWDPTRTVPDFYHVYRGTLAELLSSGRYTQNPNQVPEASSWCDLSAPALFDSDEPIPGQTLIYLAVAAQGVHGSLGFRSDLVERATGGGPTCP